MLGNPHKDVGKSHKDVGKSLKTKWNNHDFNLENSE